MVPPPLPSPPLKDNEEDFPGMKPTEVDVSGASDKDGEDDQATRSEFERLLQQEKQTVHPNSTNSINTMFLNMFLIDYTGLFLVIAYDNDSMGEEVTKTTWKLTMNVSPIPTTRIDKDHPKDQKGGCSCCGFVISTKEGALGSRHSRKGAFVLGDSRPTRVRMAVTAHLGRVWLSRTSRVRMVRGSAAGLRLAQQPQIRVCWFWL
ncbi:hypothetical protein Tco_0442912 [Tanacetum coccineum]